MRRPIKRLSYLAAIMVAIAGTNPSSAIAADNHWLQGPSIVVRLAPPTDPAKIGLGGDGLLRIEPADEQASPTTATTMSVCTLGADESCDSQSSDNEAIDTDGDGVVDATPMDDRTPTQKLKCGGADKECYQCGNSPDGYMCFCGRQACEVTDCQGGMVPCDGGARCCSTR